MLSSLLWQASQKFRRFGLTPPIRRLSASAVKNTKKRGDPNHVYMVFVKQRQNTANKTTLYTEKVILYCKEMENFYICIR